MHKLGVVDQHKLGVELLEAVEGTAYPRLHSGHGMAYHLIELILKEAVVEEGSHPGYIDGS